ncbi:magnesium transporter [Alistipes finegoldii]|uniref:magnesium transporter n=1 Tax=Alistipes finegoldii TaxID=214856 RepID=UPI003AB417F1
MDDKKINSHVILLLTVIIAGLMVAVVGRWIALAKGADVGTANLIFVIICGIAAVLYLTLVTTLSHVLTPLIAKFQSKRTPTIIIPENTPEQKAIEELPSLVPIEELKQNAEAQQAKRTAEQIRIFHEYTHYVMGAYVSEESLSRLCEYIECYARGAELSKDIMPIPTKTLSNLDLFHFGWNMADYFDVSKKYEVVPWLQLVFTNLRGLEPSYIKGKLSTPKTKHDLIPNTDKIPEELARLKG